MLQRAVARPAWKAGSSWLSYQPRSPSWTRNGTRPAPLEANSPYSTARPNSSYSEKASSGPLRILVEGGAEVGLGLEAAPEVGEIGRAHQHDAGDVAAVVVAIGALLDAGALGEFGEQPCRAPVHEVVHVALAPRRHPGEAAAGAVAVAEQRVVPTVEEEDLGVEHADEVRVQVAVHAEAEEHLLVPADGAAVPRLPRHLREPARQVDLRLVDVRARRGGATSLRRRGRGCRRRRCCALVSGRSEESSTLAGRRWVVETVTW